LAHVQEKFVFDKTENAISVLVQWTPFILEGFLLNLVISCLAMIIGTLLGVGLGLLRISRRRYLSDGARIFIQILQNTPWLVILFAVMLLVPSQFKIGSAKIVIAGWVQATVGLSLPIVANVAEILRGSVHSIPSAQWEACDSLGFNRWQALSMIILPQCYKRMLPPWMSWYAILTLATPIAAILGVREGLGSAQAAMESAGAKPEYLMPFYGFVMILFFIYIYPIARWTRWLEQRVSQ
jgi:polar amino acid transport system permease protein